MTVNPASSSEKVFGNKGAESKNERRIGARSDSEHGETRTTTTKHGATVQRNALGHFLHGQSGNPDGRPPGGPIVDLRTAVLEGAERDGVDLLERVWRCVEKHLELGADGSLASATWATNRLSGLIESATGGRGGPAVAVQFNNRPHLVQGRADGTPATSPDELLETFVGVERLRLERGLKPLLPRLMKALESAESAGIAEDGSQDGNGQPPTAATSLAIMTSKDRPLANLANPDAEEATLVEADIAEGPLRPRGNPPCDGQAAPGPRIRSKRRPEATGEEPAVGIPDAAQAEIEELLS